MLSGAGQRDRIHEMNFNMTENLWVWVGALGIVGIVALYLAFRFSKQRWPRALAVTVAGAIVSLLIGDASATIPILLTGVILAVCSAASRN